MQEKWKLAADLLEEAAQTIRDRSGQRDAGEHDTVEIAADIAGVEPIEVLDVMLAVKEARYIKSEDRDSAVDWLAYRARAFADSVRDWTVTDSREAYMPRSDELKAVGEAIAAGHPATGGGESSQTLLTAGEFEAPPLTPAQEVLIERADEDAPTAHLKAGEAVNA